MTDIVQTVMKLGFPWQTRDPFLFCVHHDDAYPTGNADMGPNASLAGRNIGMDFAGKDGWRMYHGDVVPGFPRHPHRGFETITLVRKGFIDHSDSLGATARFGDGDVQWMTAGRGIVHAEMFPLRDREAPNPLELFQIWINLPSVDKLVDPYFTMLWDHTIPKIELRDDAGRGTRIAVVAGRLGDVAAAQAPPNSWAARAEADVAIWTLALDPQAICTLPPARPGTNRTLYLFEGSSVRVGDRELAGYLGAQIVPTAELRLENGPDRAQLLLLQGRPIGEPVAHHGPFVMNTRAELQQAFVDYQRDGFGGWPWTSDGPVHPRQRGRFAIHADGREEDVDGGAAP